ncbi:DUF2235 domain-containing protein [Spirosoma taeanense]|uniref:DUF2235 domain-containing protein n=1 Tax=Spirosoma taeanense TaxID=2735870 RepID=A0A6M5Y4N8_9BACT|nr:DUF2235 domain-containing protein [Spirosoma taeanense]QJW88745.1 DUF2235 domain-containing protein [Spirosoma taeanense]
MPKNIVICCDGTWNSATDEEFGMPTATNVRLLFQACQTAAESDDKQVTWYQSGIGALGGNSRRAFEGATGTGMGANIRRGYLAIARYYEPGDHIFLFGFSRGAFTARSIAGMIRQVGLVDPDAKVVEKAYRFYESNKYLHNDPKTHYDYPKFKPGRAPGQVRIHFIGVWDTVGSLGFSFWGWSFNLRFFRNGFHELSPNSITDNVYHALAMDEIRTSFMPSLWELPQSGEHRPECVEQAWFRGVHSDVGGGTRIGTWLTSP